MDHARVRRAVARQRLQAIEMRVTARICRARALAMRAEDAVCRARAHALHQADVDLRAHLAATRAGLRVTPGG